MAHIAIYTKRCCLVTITHAKSFKFRASLDNVTYSKYLYEFIFVIVVHCMIIITCYLLETTMGQKQFNILKIMHILGKWGWSFCF